ncbi:MAG: hypothetical protein C0582_04295 [Alphaproteobacteria bacterium]|nr:MAG: hypothetical protein C0582_04295 [Alphaproteobacteria bacterium]
MNIWRTAGLQVRVTVTMPVERVVLNLAAMKVVAINVTGAKKKGVFILAKGSFYQKILRQNQYV